MSNHNSRARGLVGVRANADDPKVVINELMTAFEAFKSENNEELAAIKKGQADVVKAEKVDRINTEITSLQTAVDDMNKSMAALKVGGSGGELADPAKAEYSAAFNKFFRKGIEGNLSELAVKAALQTDSDPDGGYTVPETMEAGIDRVMGTVSAMRRISRVVNVSTQSYKKLVNLAGTASGWVGEREARAETNTPTLSQLTFNAMELYANPAATQSMLDDSRVNIEMWIADEVATEFAEAEGTAFVSGDGVNQPRGILAYNTVADASYAWGSLGFTATSVAADINDGTYDGIQSLLSLIYSLKQGYRSGASFLMNRTLQSKYRKLVNLTSGDYLWQPSAQLGQPATLAGYPVVDDDNMPDVAANAFPVAFGNFQRGYLIVDRQGIRVLRDPFTNKPYVHFYTTKRVGGGVQNYEAIKLLKCSA